MKDTFAYLIKIGIACAARVLLFPLRLMPIRSNRVLFECYREKEYACNPKYVSQALCDMARGRAEIAWSFREPERFRFLEKQGVRVLRSGSWEALTYAMTARVVCVNTYYKPTLPRRRGQFIVRTWHGGGAYKRVGRMEKLGRLKRAYMAMQLSGASLYLSSSRAFTRLTVRDSFGYRGEVLEAGMPRNDILIRGASAGEMARIRREIGLTDGRKLVVYAPTYRYDRAARAFDIDLAALTASLSARFGGEWVAGVRAHTLTRGALRAENALDLNEYPDMQELLLAADALVTDYSSCIWDMSLTGKPVFLYATDLDRYRAGRDFYTDIRTWPFPLAENNADLAENIRRFDETTYLSAVKAHHKALGSCETGRASRLAAERILTEIDRGRRKRS